MSAVTTKGSRSRSLPISRRLPRPNKKARQHRGTDRLAQAAPASRELLTQAAERGDNLGSITATLLRLLEQYGATELQAAILEALQRGVPHPNAVRLSLEHRREQRELPPALATPLSEDARTRERPVRPHDLEDYDQLKQENEDDADE